MEIINKVAQSSIVSIDLESFFPEEKICEFDMKQYLFKELILKEKDFRQALTEVDWKQFENSYLTIYCSNDAIIPQWAYMLVAVYAQPYIKNIYFGSKEEALKSIYLEKLSELTISDYQNQRVVIKGCSNKPVPADAYIRITNILRPVVKSIMYGEPCSTVPLFKKKEQ